PGAGRGTILLGDGSGRRFTATDLSTAGVAVSRRPRSVAASDFDRDGRVDLAVGQHGAPTLLWRNASARPGLRVRLHYDAIGNPDGIGAWIRVRGGDGQLSGVHEVRAGGGWLAQHSSISVITAPAAVEPQGLRVRWPDGRE